MSPLAVKAGCAERTANSQQKPKGLPSLPMATQDRLLHTTQSLSEALPHGALNIQQQAASWLAPVLPSSAATDSDRSSNGAGNNGLAPATGLPHGMANGALPPPGISDKATARATITTTNRYPATATAPLPVPAQPPSSRGVARLRAILRRLRATAQANKGARVKIRLTAQGLARAKAALLKARSAPQSGPGPQAISLGHRPTRQPPEPVGSGQAVAPSPAPARDPVSVKPQPAAVQPGPSTRSGKPKKPKTLGKPKTSSAPPRSPAPVPSGNGAPETKVGQDAQKRHRQTGQSFRTGAKGVYTEDSIRVYLQEIGRIRLLRPDEEIELARKIADLLYLEQEAETYFHENERHPSMSEWAEQVSMPYRSFKRRLKLGRRAKEKMVQSNLRLVVSIAKKYMNRGLSFQDLIQEGSLGLVRAAEKFDHEKGYKFSTYATWWIRQAITRAIADQSRTIRLPVHLYETISRIKKSTKTLSQELGRKPSEEEIAERMEMTIEKLRFIAKSAQLPISLETPIGKEEDSRLGDFIESGTENPDQDVAKNLLREDLESVLATLNPRERDVLRLRYGLDDGRMKTLEDIGQIFDVTRERIRQIEAKALRKLRHPNRNGVLKEYIK